MTLAEVLARLDRVTKAGDGFKARCPAHDDVQASLSLRCADDGRILVNCFAGCSFAAIAEAMGLEARDFSPTNGTTPKPQIVATYDYFDEAGELLYQSVRYSPKDFRQRRPDGKGGWTWNLRGVRRVLYRLPVLLAADPRRAVFLVEGEKDADRLVSVKLLATTHAGGAKSWRAEYAAALSGRAVIVIPDNDEPGRGWCADVVRDVPDVRVLQLPGLDVGGDVSDYLQQHTVDDLKALARQSVPGQSWSPTPAAVDDAGWDAPAPFATVDVPPFPVEALPSWLGQWVDGVATETQTPPDLAALLGLGVLATCISNRVRVLIRPGYTEPLNLFVAVAMFPAERKSAVFSRATAAVEQWEAEESDRLRPGVVEDQHELAVLQKRVDHLQAQAVRAKQPLQREALLDEMRAVAVERDRFRPRSLPRLVADDATPERLISLLVDHNERMAVLSPEGGVFDLMAGRYGSDGRMNLDVYLKGHCGDPIRTDRVGRASEHLRNPALTVALAVQPDVIAGLADRPGFKGRGLLARFLYSLPAPRAGCRDMSREALSATTPAVLTATYKQVVRTLLGLQLQEGATIGLTSSALDRWVGFCAWLEPQLAPASGELAHLAGWGGKLAGAVARIAGLLHAAEHCGDPCGERITPETMAAAISIARYLIPHARAAFAAMGADPAVETARKVLRWIETADSPTFAMRDCYRAHRGLFGKVTDVRPVLGLLEQHGYVRQAPTERDGPGRKPSPTYEINPKVKR